MTFNYRRLSEVGEIITGTTPPKSHPEWFSEDGIPFLTPNDMDFRVRQVETRRYLSSEGETRLSSKLLAPGSTAVACIGSVGKICLVRERSVSNQQVNTFIPNTDILNPIFTYYAMIEIAEYLPQIAGGSTLPIVNKTLFSEQEIIVPPLRTQEVIGSTLGALDDKIESNHRIRNHILDLCRLKFSILFGDLGDETPGQQVITLDKIGRIVGGGTPSKKKPDYYSSDAIAWLTPRDLAKSKDVFRQHGELDISEEGLQKSSAQLLPAGTILFTSRAPIGYLAIASGQTSTSQGFKSIVPHGGFGTPFTFFLLESLTPKIQAHAGGSTFKEISKTGMSAIRLTEPDLQDVSTFNNYSGPLLERLASCERESARLSALRDVLLPELMSGRIRVRDVKSTVEDAVDQELPEVQDV